MKIVFHQDFLDSYDMTPAGKTNRLTPIYEKIKNNSQFPIVRAKAASIDQIERAHSKSYIHSLEIESTPRAKKIWNMSLLAAGGAIITATIASKGESAFGLIRPPGHHASYNSAWGFCYLNNLAISLLHLRATTSIHTAFILDFDLHLGDGNINILQRYIGYEVYNPEASTESEYIGKIRNRLLETQKADIIVASAGFDQGRYDWGQLLSKKGYKEIGKLMKEYAQLNCDGRRYALLEGGYNPPHMANNILAFLKGFS